MSNGFDDFYAIIPAGGTGTRLWPLSREAKPKFLFDLLGSGRTLIQSTFDRLAAIAGMTMCASAPANGMWTPWRSRCPRWRRNTSSPNRHRVIPRPPLRSPPPCSPAGTATTLWSIVRRRPCDPRQGGVRRRRAAGRRHRRAGYVTTIGIAASRPSTAFGYIHEGESLAAAFPTPRTPCSWNASWRSRTPPPRRPT